MTHTITGIAHGYLENSWQIHDPYTGAILPEDFSGHIVSWYGDAAKIIHVTPESTGVICDATPRNIEFQPYNA